VTGSRTTAFDIAGSGRYIRAFIPENAGPDRVADRPKRHRDDRPTPRPGLPLRRLRAYRDNPMAGAESVLPAAKA
jgi:hypothetical protein